MAICVDCDESRIDRRIDHRYLDTKAADIDEALALAIEARDARRPLSIGLVGNAAEVFPELLERDAPIDIVTDQTSAHDPLSYLPTGVLFEDMKKMAEKDPVYFTEQARESMAKHVKAMVGFMDKGAEVFDYGNSIRDEARKAGYDRAFDFPGFVPAYIRPQFEEGLGPFRWAALSGDPKDIEATDRAILELFPDNDASAALDHHGRRTSRLPGPACPDLLARLRRTAQGRAEVQRDGRIRRAVGADRHRPRPPGLRLGRVARIGRPRRWPTAPTPSRTGRC